jgi:hypothetical protein
MGAFSGSEEYARDSWNAVSSDGSRVYFTEPPSSAKPERELRIRENADQEQSKVEGGRCVEPVKACTVLVGGEYWTATPDGRYAYSTEGEALWRFNVEGEAGHEREEIAGGVVGVIGINETGEDGAYVYFVSKSALTAPANGEGEEPAVGQPNVYLDHDGQLTFIARLAAGDETDWGRVGGIRNGLKLDTAVVSLDGTHLAFVSERSLTGYDNRQAEPGECEQSGASSGEGGINETGSCREVYLYDAATGGLVCASCDPSGARPVGPSSLGEKEGSEDVEYQRRNLSADGSRLFFESFDALLPHDSDGRQNVFEYEDGHVYPVSDVAGDSNSYFLDASASGSDVFIATADQLLARGSSDRIAVYDARVGGGFPVSVSAPPCDNGDSCKPPPAAQPGVFGAPASATFSGTGNLAPVPVGPAPKQARKVAARCPKTEKASRGRCVKEKHKPRRAKAKKASEERRAER